MKKIRIVLTIILITLMSISLTGCENKETPYGEKYKFEIVDKETEFDIPVYFLSEDENRKEITIEGLQFLNNTMKYKFTDWKMGDTDENGNVTISYTLKITGDVDFIVPETNTTRWFYTFSISDPFAFDYYTGDIYRENKTNENNNTTIMENGIENKNADEMKYTEVTFNKSTTKIGIESKHDFKGYNNVKYLGKENGYYHYKGPVESEVTTYITMPKDYDGVMIAIRKKGITEEDNKKDVEEYNKLVELQKQAQETGNKSEELINLEKENDRVHKIIDSNDESRKEAIIEDYYVIKTADIFNIQSKKQETNYMPIIIAGVLGVAIIAVGVIIIIKKKTKKENRRTKRPLNK